MKALDRQIAGMHYRDFPIQPVQMIAANGYDYFIGNILKYVCRWRFKGGLTDLEKAIHYAELRRDINLHRHRSIIVEKVETTMARLWFWRIRRESKIEYKLAIPMRTFIQVNDIPPYDDHVLYALDQLHHGLVTEGYFIVVMRQFIRNKFPETA